MKITAPVLSCAFTLLAASHAHSMQTDSIGHYTTGLIPKSYGHCESLKPEISRAFMEAANVELLSTECSSRSSGSVLTLNYVETSRPVEFNTTRGRSVNDDIAGRGYIKTETECETRKPGVVQVFKAATGLNPFLVYCTEDEAANSSTHPWHVAIEAVGIGNMTYQYIDRMLSDGMSTNPEALTTEIKQYFSSRPDTMVVDAVYRIDNISFARVGIALLAKKRVSINKYEFLTTRSERDCGFEADELKAAALRAGMPVVGHGCQFRQSDYHKTFLITETRSQLSYDTTGITFDTMEACRAAREVLFQDMRRRLGDTVVGISCRSGADQPTAFVIFRP